MEIQKKTKKYEKRILEKFRKEINKKEVKRINEKRKKKEIQERMKICRINERNAEMKQEINTEKKELYNN